MFFAFNASDFLTAYINIPIFVVLYVGWKILKRTKVWRPEDMDFVTVRVFLWSNVAQKCDFISRVYRPLRKRTNQLKSQEIF